MIVISSSNKGKIKEFNDLLGGKFEIKSMADMGLGDLEIVEDGSSLRENSYIKAKTVFDLLGENTLSDDTGLFIDYLDGRPGIYSHRYAGEGLPFSLNIKKVLSELKDVDLEDRTCEFRTVITYIDKAKGEPMFFEGICKGRISFEEKGDRGFGYDSIFMPEGSNLTWAQMTDEEKNKSSHRSKALKKLVEYLI